MNSCKLTVPFESNEFHILEFNHLAEKYLKGVGAALDWNNHKQSCIATIYKTSILY